MPPPTQNCRAIVADAPIIIASTHTANKMTEPTLDDLVSEAGLDASLADAFRSEDVTVEILLNSSLTGGARCSVP